MRIQLSGRNDEMLEQIVARLCLEESVSAQLAVVAGIGRSSSERGRGCCRGHLAAAAKDRRRYVA
jgi:hypothetical protein